jgi:integrase
VARTTRSRSATSSMAAPRRRAAQHAGTQGGRHPQLLRLRAAGGSLTEDVAGAARRAAAGQLPAGRADADEVDRILDAPPATTRSGSATRPILELLYACGLRVSELTGLDTDRLDLAACRCGSSARATGAPRTDGGGGARADPRIPGLVRARHGRRDTPRRRSS